jgi:hypothetical protein
VSRASVRALGVLPLGFFALYLALAAQGGKAADSLWLCHVANLLLGVGLLAGRPRVAAVGIAWIVLGIPLWALDTWRSASLTPVSLLSHLGGLAVGLYAASRLRISFNPWLAALLLFVALRELCRWFTPEARNVNLAHAAYPGWEGMPGGYGGYWLATTLAAAAALWGVGRLLTMCFKGEA